MGNSAMDNLYSGRWSQSSTAFGWLIPKPDICTDFKMGKFRRDWGIY